MSNQSVHTLVANEAAANSSAVFVYNSTPTAAFSEGLKAPAGSHTKVFHMQTRPGAGASLVGYIESIAFTSKGAQPAETQESEDVEEALVPAKRPSRTTGSTQSSKKLRSVPASSQPVSILGSTASLLALVPSLLSLPIPGVRPAVAVHVSAQTSTLDRDSDGQPTLVQVPDLPSFFEASDALAAGGFQGAIVASENADEAAFVSSGLAASVTSAGHDIVSVFDGLTTGRQLSKIGPSPARSGVSSDLVSVLKANVPFFKYYGSQDATQVVVVPASVYSANAKGALASLSLTDVGVLVVRVIKPWQSDDFVAALPSAAKALHVFAIGDNSNGVFKDDILSSLLSSTSGLKVKVRALQVESSNVPSVSEWVTVLKHVSPSASNASPKAILPAKAKIAEFWSLDSSSSEAQLLPTRLSHAFADEKTGVRAVLQTTYDNFRQGGVQQDLLLLEPRDAAAHDLSVGAIAGASPASLVFISNATAVFKAYEPISDLSVGPETRIVISSNWTAEEAKEKLPFSARKSLTTRLTNKGGLVIVDADKIASTYSIPPLQVAELIFWTLYLPASISAKEIVSLLSGTPTFSSAAWDHKKLVEVNSAVRNAIVQVDVSSLSTDDSMVVDGEGEGAPSLPATLIPTAAGPNLDRTFPDPVTRKVTWHSVAQRLMYPEAFDRVADVEERLRPDLPEKTYQIRVSETRRLTPNTYDRNVFHMEFDLQGTGLKYAVGEALGIHGWNDTEEVRDFLEWYGLNGDDVIDVPARGNPSGRIEQRTVFQMFQQNLDIFGKPGKSFYQILAKYATNKNEERALRFIGSPEGSATFKKMNEIDTVTYADVLRQFTSAKPSIDDLVREIEPIEPRHYSIASSQNFVGDSVHLLIVTVEWKTPKGSPRYGQCTRYLSSLKAGDLVTVSVKPSVMKLPPSDTAPVIMAGLGTGAAPFRAFIQERAWQKAQGREIGPSLYYFGSRHRSKEYLYGEEIEAYLQEGILSHTGLAFSRDTNRKVYIQHKMNEDSELLAKSLIEGSFYLCGPTWPAPDVYEALVKALVGNGKSLDAAQAYIEELKEQER